MRWLALLVMLGCYTPVQMPTPPTITFSERWSGHSRDDVVFTFGSPNETLALSNGNALLSYHYEGVVSSASHGGFANSAAAFSKGKATTRTVWCDRRFEVDKNLVVVRAMIAGDGCE